MVFLSIVDGDHSPIRRREDRVPESKEPVERLDRDHGSPVSNGGCSSPPVHLHKVDSESLSQEVRAVARHLPRRCVHPTQAANGSDSTTGGLS
jgi:hypothetical protein